MQQFFSLLSWRLFTAQHVSGVFPPIISSSVTAVAAGQTTNTARMSPRYEGKTRGCHCSHWAPDDGRENARNMFRTDPLSIIRSLNTALFLKFILIKNSKCFGQIHCPSSGVSTLHYFSNLFWWRTLHVSDRFTVHHQESQHCTISEIYFGTELYMFRTDPLSIIRSLNTVYTAIDICHASYVDCLLARSGWNSSQDNQHD